MRVGQFEFWHSQSFNKVIPKGRGESKNFSRGGVSKKNSNFYLPFCRSTKLTFRAFTNLYKKKQVLTTFSAPHADFWRKKKQAKNGKIRFVVEKKNLGQFSKLLLKNFCVVYWNCMVRIFFKKKFKSVFLSPLCSIVLKEPQKWFNFFLLFFENVWKLYDKHFLHTPGVWNCIIMIFVAWNCMISIFGVWRSTRVL